MNSNYDLDINNYSFDDVLNLFSIDSALSPDSMKQARRIALMTHPDKSSLPTTSL